MKNRHLSWNDINIGTFQKIAEIESKPRTENTDYELVAAINNMTLEQVLDLPLDEVHNMMVELSYLEEKPKSRLPKGTYEINGRKYKCMMNLNDMTTAQYIDFKQIAPDYIKYLPQFLSIFLIPEGYGYNKGYNIEFVQSEISKHFSVEDGMAMAAFFLSLCEISMRLLLRSSRRMMRKAKRTGDPAVKEQAQRMEEVIRMLSKGQRSIFG